MSVDSTMVYLIRHCQTAWSLSGQHTGRTDLPLTEKGERDAVLLGERLRAIMFNRVLTSPVQRARRTCELAGFGQVAVVDDDLNEWNYGAYEGRRSSEIRAERPNWEIYRDGCPGGETPAQVAARADRVVSQLRALPGITLLFSSGHFLRMLAARWLGVAPTVFSTFLMLDAGSLSTLGYQSNLCPVIWHWNETHHLEGKA